MVCVSQSAVLPSLLAAPTLATKCVLIWTTTAALRAPTATGGVETLEWSCDLRTCDLCTTWSKQLYFNVIPILIIYLYACQHVMHIRRYILYITKDFVQGLYINITAVVKIIYTWEIWSICLKRKCFFWSSWILYIIYVNSSGRKYIVDAGGEGERLYIQNRTSTNG